MNLSIYNSRKSQAAMEFLMTYGWAILVVLAAIAGLAYFGILDPGKLLPEKCTMQPGIACVSHKVESSKVTLVLSNALGKTITINSIDVGGCSSAGIGKTLLSGDESTVVVGGTCNNGIAKEKYKADITLKYTEKDTNLSKTYYGNLNTKVEE